MALYKSPSVDLPGKPGTEAGIRAGVRAQKTAEIRTEILLSLVEASPALRRV